MHGGCGRISAALLVAVALLFAVGVKLTFADGGDGYKMPLEQGCRTHSWTSDEGKTPNGWTAEAVDASGCHKVNWTSSIGPDACRGQVTFLTTRPQDSDPFSPNFPDTGSYCEMRAVHEANLYFVNLFKVSPGTEVTVRYVGD